MKANFVYEEILYLKATGNYTTIYFVDGTSHVSSYTLKKIFGQMMKSERFIRIHKNCAVNLKYLKKKVSKVQGHFCVLTTGQSLAISRRNQNLIS